MPYSEFLGWMAYAKVEPFGEIRMDHRFAYMMAFYANSNRDPKTKREPFKISDFVLQHEGGDGDGEEYKPKQTKEQHISNLLAWKSLFPEKPAVQEPAKQ